MSNLSFGPEGVGPSDVLHLYQRAALSQGEFERAVAWSTEPPSRTEWRNALSGFFLFFGVALVVSGVILFGAYNWQSLPRLGKLGFLQALVVGFWLAGRLRPADGIESSALLWGASLLVGAHLAVFGQVYQTGADSHSLFTVWSVLILPWCIASRANLFWFTQAILLNVAFVLFWQQRVGDDFASFALSYAIFNIFLAGLWIRVRKYHEWMSSGLPDLLFAAALVPLTGAASLAFWEGGLHLFCLLATVLLWVALLGAYFKQLQTMAVVASSVLFIWGALLTRVFLELGEFGMLLIGLGILALLTPTVGFLRKVHARSSIREPFEAQEAPQTTSQPKLSTLEVLHANNLLDISLEERDQIEPEPPFFIGCFTAMGGWFASLFLLVFILAVAVNSESFLVPVGLVLWIGSVIGRYSSRSEFFSHLCFALHLAGCCLVVVGSSLSFNHDDMSVVYLCALAVQAASLFLFKDTVARGVFSLGTVVAGGLWAHELAGGQGLSVWLLLVAGLLTFLLSKQRAWLLGTWRDFYRPVVLGSTAGLLTMVGVHSFAPAWVWGAEILPPWLMTVGLVGLTCYAAFHAKAPIGAVLGLVLLNLIAGSVPGLGAAVLVFILAFQAKNSDLFGLSFGGILVFGVQYYYNLDMTFLVKSVTLVASGALLLVTRRLLTSGTAQEGEAL